MFKKILSTMLLSTLFIANSSADVSFSDIEKVDLSSDKFSKEMQKSYSKVHSENFGKKVTIDVLKSQYKSKVSIKNGTCDDYTMFKAIIRHALTKSTQARDVYSQSDIDKIIIMTYRMDAASSNAERKLGCK